MATQFASVVMNQSAQRFVWRVSSTVIYILYQDQGDFTNPTNFHMMKSSNNGSTFAEVDSTHKPQSAASNEKGWTGAIDNNGLIHIAIGSSTLGSVGYITFNTSTDLWGTQAVAYTLPSGVNANIAQFYLALDKNNIPHIVTSYSTLVGGNSAAFLNYTNRIGGTWLSGPSWQPNGGKSQIFGDFLIDRKDNIPIIISNQDDSVPSFGALVVHYGNANNASSFTTFTIGTGLMFNTARISMVQDDLFNTYVGYYNKTSSFQTLRKHVAGDSWSTWSAENSMGVATTSNGSASLVAAGRNIYYLYTKTSTGIGMNLWNGQFWSGETIITADSTKSQPLGRYSNINQFSPATIDYAMKGSGASEFFETYAGTTNMMAYFDGSDAAATDPNSSWTNDANAFDGSFSTAATSTVTSNTTTGFLKAEGTNAPTVGGPISTVRARIYGKGSSDGAAAYGSYTTLTAPTGGWTWQKLNDLEVKIISNAAASATPANVQAVIYTDTLAENLGTATYTSASNAPQTMSAYRVELDIAYVAFATYTPTHSTDAVKKIIGLPTHTTDANKKRSQTKVHTTSAVKRRQIAITHTTSSVLKGTLTKFHTTSSNKKVVSILKTHTTDAMRHTTATRTHSTDSFKRTQNVRSHTTDSLLRKQVALSHTTDSLKRKTNTRTHTTDANKKKTLTIAHTADALVRKTNTRSHTTNSYIQPSIGTFSTDYFDLTFVPVKVTYTITHSTDANKRKATLVSHTTDSLKRKTSTVSHSTDSNKRKATTVSHTTDSLKRTQTVKTHTTDALKRKQFTKTHTTDSLLRKQNTRVHTTDANKKKTTLVSHTTDANKRKTLSVAHTTDALKRKQNTRTHTTDSFKRTRNVISHTTNSLLRRQLTVTHTTNSLLRRQITKTHTTDALKRRQLTIFHTTSANKRKATLVTHTTDSNKRKLTLRTHTTDSLLRRQLTRVHTTDALKRAARVLTHTTNSFLRKANTVSHTTNSLLRRFVAVSHLTDALKRKTNVVAHATDANKRSANVIRTHTTDALIRKFNSVSHSTNALIRKLHVLTHATDASTRTRQLVSHATDALVRKSRQLTHTTDANKNRRNTVSHTTSGVVGTQHSTQHRTDASKWSKRGTKKVLVSGIWHYGIVKVLSGGIWTIATVRYFNGTDWPSTED